MYFITLVSNSNPTVLFIFEHHSAWLFHQSPKVFRFFLLPLLHRFNWENFTYFWLKVLLCLRAYKQALYFSDVSGCDSATWPCNTVCVFFSWSPKWATVMPSTHSILESLLDLWLAHNATIHFWQWTERNTLSTHSAYWTAFCLLWIAIEDIEVRL